jgi:hypothetical protein
MMMNSIGLATHLDGRGLDLRERLRPYAGRRACSRRHRPREQAWGVRLAEGGSPPIMLPGRGTDRTSVVKAGQWPSPLQSAASPVPDR